MASMAAKKTIVVGGCVGLCILLCLVPFVHNLALALAVLSLALALVAAVQAQSWAISSDIVPDSHAARFGGIMNFGGRSEEHTSELQSRGHLVCRRLLGQTSR